MWWCIIIWERHLSAWYWIALKFVMKYLSHNVFEYTQHLISSLELPQLWYRSSIPLTPPWCASTRYMIYKLSMLCHHCTSNNEACHQSIWRCILWPTWLIRMKWKFEVFGGLGSWIWYWYWFWNPACWWTYVSSRHLDVGAPKEHRFPHREKLQLNIFPIFYMNLHTALWVFVILVGSAVLKLDQARKELSSVLMDTDQLKDGNCKSIIWGKMY